jgi:hypothetical protein
MNKLKYTYILSYMEYPIVIKKQNDPNRKNTTKKRPPVELSVRLESMDKLFQKEEAKPEEKSDETYEPLLEIPKEVILMKKLKKLQLDYNDKLIFNIDKNGMPKEFSKLYLFLFFDYIK